MKAFETAFSNGAKGIEFDVRSCQSGEIVVIHDETIDRTSNGSGKVDKMTLKELQKFDFGRGEKIPTLESVLKKYGEKYWLNIEIKESGLENSLLKLLVQNNIKKKIVISSFQISVINTIKSLNPEIETAYLYDFPLEELDDLLEEINIEGLHPGKNYVSEALIRKAHALGLKVRSWTIDDEKLATKYARWGIDGIITNVPERLIKVI